jgi:hypothetical protein
MGRGDNYWESKQRLPRILFQHGVLGWCLQHCQRCHPHNAASIEPRACCLGSAMIKPCWQATFVPTCSLTCRGDPIGGIMGAPPARAGSVAPPPPVEGTRGLREGEVPAHTCAGNQPGLAASTAASTSSFTRGLREGDVPANTCAGRALNSPALFVGVVWTSA